jgi:hypothetical protein
MRPSATSILAIGALAGLLAGCGGGDDSRAARANPDALLDSAFAHPVRSAETESRLRFALEGSAALSEPVAVKLTGPYVSGQGARIPSFDWRFKLELLGFDIGGKLVSTGENVFISPFGDNYEVGRDAVAGLNQQVAGLSIRPPEWFGTARYEGEEDVAGVDAAHLSADLQGKKVSETLRPLRDALGLSHFPSPVGRIDAWIGLDDELVHELSIDAAFRFAPEDRAKLGGARGGSLQIDTVLDEINEQQTIRIPGGGGYKPISDLVLTLQDLGAFGR